MLRPPQSAHSSVRKPAALQARHSQTYLFQAVHKNVHLELNQGSYLDPSVLGGGNPQNRRSGGKCPETQLPDVVAL